MNLAFVIVFIIEGCTGAKSLLTQTHPTLVWPLYVANQACVHLLLVSCEDIICGDYTCCNLRGHDRGGYSLVNSSLRYKF